MDKRTYDLLLYISKAQVPLNISSFPIGIEVEFASKADLFSELLTLSKKRLLHKVVTAVNSPYDGLFSISDKGREAIVNAKLMFDNEALKEKLEFEKLKHETKVAKWMSKTYWWTFALAIAGTLVGIVALIISIIKK